MVFLFAVIRNTGGRPGYKKHVSDPARMVDFKVLEKHPNVYIQKGTGINLYFGSNFTDKYIDLERINIDSS